MSNKKNKRSISKPVGFRTYGVYIGVGLLTTGFIVLFWVDRMAANWAGFIVPVLFVASWIVISTALWGRKNG